MTDWNQYRKEARKSVAQFASVAPDTLAGVSALEKAGDKSNLLGNKVHELIALACAITTRCDGCIAFHTEIALKTGATEGEIAEALNVGIYMNTGAAVVYSSKVIDAIRQAK